MKRLWWHNVLWASRIAFSEFERLFERVLASHSYAARSEGGEMRRLEMLSCARTAAIISRHTDKKHKEHDPTMGRETNLSLLVQGFALTL